VADELKIILRAINQASGPIDDVRGSMSRLSGAAGDLHTKALLPLRNMLGSGLKVAAGATVAAVGALVATIGSSVGAAADMEQGIADISAAMGASTEETGKLKKLIENLGFDPQLKVTATEAAEAIGTLGTAGLSVDEILNGAARSTVLLANATGAQFGDAAGIASDVMSLFNIKAADMARAVDGITSTTIASKFNINDYRLALAQAGGVAATVGVGFDDFNATIAAIAPYFASGSDAGTSFKTFLQRLIPASSAAEDSMRALGLISLDVGLAAKGLSEKLGYEVAPTMEAVKEAAAEYTYQILDVKAGSKELAEETEKLLNQYRRNEFFTATGEMKDMSEVVGVLQGAFKDLTEEQKNEQLATIFGTDAMRAAAAMAGMTEQQFADLKATMAKTDAEESAAKRMDTFRGVMEILGGVVDTLKVQIGDAFLPTLRRLAELFTAQAQIHGPAIVEMFRGLAGQLEVSLQKFMPWIEQALPRLIAQIPGVVANMIELGKQFVAAATMVYNAVAPVVSFVAGLVDLKGILLIVGGLMAVSAVASVVSFVASIVGAVASVVSFVASIGGVLGSLGGLGVALGGAGAAFTAILAAIGPVILIVGAVGAAIAALYLAWQNNWFGIRDITQQALAMVRDLLANFPETIAGLKEAFFTWASGAMQRLRDGFTAAKQMVLDGLGWVVDGIRSFFGERIVPLGQQMFDRGVDVLRRLRDGFANAISEPRAALENALNHVRNLVGEHLGPTGQQLFDRGVDVLRRLRDGFANAISEPRAALENALNHVRNLVGEHLGPTGQQMFDRGRDVLRRLGDGFREMGGQAREEMRRVLADIQERGVAEGLGLLAGRMYEKAREGMGRFVAGVNEAAPNLRNDVQRALNAVTEVANGWIGGAGNHLNAKGREAVQRMADGMNAINLAAGIGGALGKIITEVNNWSGGAGNHLLAKGREAMERFRDGMTGFDFAGNFRGALNRIVDEVNNWSNSVRDHIFNKAKEVGQRLMDGLRDGISGGISAVLSQIQNITNMLPQWVKDQLGIHSPSTVFAGLGRNIMEGLVVGMQELAAAPQGVLAGVAASLTPGDNNGLSVGASAGAGAVYNNQRTTQNHFTVASGTSADADLMERVRVLNMLYGGA
jgi:TP901 family phage tail tape measure protein